MEMAMQYQSKAKSQTAYIKWNPNNVLQKLSQQQQKSSFRKSDSSALGSYQNLDNEWLGLI